MLKAEEIANIENILGMKLNDDIELALTILNNLYVKQKL
jgi:hypothetical protein